MNIITGLRRSGTSMLMLALKEAGITVIGDKFDRKKPTKKQLDGNPNGYWEVEGVCTEGLKEKLGYKNDLVKVMFEALPESDPELINKAVAIFRKPKKVLASILKSNKIDYVDLFIKNLELDIIDTLDFLKDKEHIIVFYEDIIAKPEEEFKKICKFLKKGDPKKAASVVDKKLDREKDTEHNVDILEAMYNMVKLGKIEEIIALKDNIEFEANILLKHHDEKNNK